MLLPDQEEFFRFFGLTPPPNLTVDGAKRFMDAYLREPERAARWKQHTHGGIAQPTAAPAPAAPPAPAAAPPPSPPPVQAAAHRHDHPGPVARRFDFTGSGAEYFRIWIVNLLLTIVTLGIYSAWAKVRRLQYFYRHTQLAGSSFDYHGDPKAILKGRLIALGLFLIYSFAGKVSPVLGLVTLVALGAVLPVLLRNSFRFRMRYSSYRGLRFRFTGDTPGAYWAFLIRPLIAVFTLNLALPWAHQRLKAYQHGSTSFGKTPFTFDAASRQFYKEYMIVGLTSIALLVVPVFLIFSAISTMAELAQTTGAPPNPAAVAGTITFAVIWFFAAGLAIAPLYQARLQNLTWDHTCLGPHRFESDLSFWRLFGIHFTNMLLVGLTFGLFLPWAAVRVARYRVEALQLIVDGGLESFIGEQEPETSALGEETADMFDIDIAL